MDKNTINNLFDRAIEKHELEKLAVGEDEYFIPDREYGGHWIYAVWCYHILTSQRSELEKEKCVCDMIQELIKSDMDIEPKGELLLYHFHAFYYLLKEGRFKFDYLKSVESDSVNIFEHYIDQKKTREKERLLLAPSKGSKTTVGY